MKTLVINASPKGNHSNTMVLTNAFIKGLESHKDNQVEVVNLVEKKIEHCMGCFVCWKKPPHSCVIDDDLNELLVKHIESDLVVWSFPLYHYNVPSKMKCLMDRTLPISQVLWFVDRGFMLEEAKSRTQSHIIISTCGLNEIGEMYEPVIKSFEMLHGTTKYQRIILPCGDIWKHTELCPSVIGFLTHIEEAGKQCAKNRHFSEEIYQRLTSKFPPQDIDFPGLFKTWINGGI